MDRFLRCDRTGVPPDRWGRSIRFLAVMALNDGTASDWESRPEPSACWPLPTEAVKYCQSIYRAARYAARHKGPNQ